MIVTPSESAAPTEFRAAEAAASDPRSGKDRLLHATMPEKPTGSEAVSAFIAKAAGDRRVKAIVVAPAVAGTAEGFRRAKEARADLVCIAAGSKEDELLVESAADLVVDLDRVYRSYFVPWAAKKMGARTLVAAYSAAELSDPAAAREQAIMAAASTDLGLRFVAMTSPAGTSPAAFARAGTGAWFRDYGPDTALFAPNAALAAPLIAGAIAGGGMVVDVGGEATRAVYASVLGLDLSPAKGDAKKELRSIESALAALGLRGRMGAWDSGYAEASVEGLGEFALRLAAGSAKKDALKDLVAALDARSSGAAWIADYDVDEISGVRSANRVLLRQDIYVLGRGYLQSAIQQVPSKYLELRVAAK
jgi:hypothetical protein